MALALSPCVNINEQGDQKLSPESYQRNSLPLISINSVALWRGSFSQSLENKHPLLQVLIIGHSWRSISVSNIDLLPTTCLCPVSNDSHAMGIPNMPSLSLRCSTVGYLKLVAKKKRKNRYLGWIIVVSLVARIQPAIYQLRRVASFFSSVDSGWMVGGFSERIKTCVLFLVSPFSSNSPCTPLDGEFIWR